MIVLGGFVVPPIVSPSRLSGQTTGDIEGPSNSLSDSIDLGVLRNILANASVAAESERLLTAAPCQELRFLLVGVDSTGGRDYEFRMRFHEPGASLQTILSVAYSYDPSSGSNPSVPPDLFALTVDEVPAELDPSVSIVPDLTCYRFLQYVLEEHHRALEMSMRRRTSIAIVRLESVTDLTGTTTCVLRLELRRKSSVHVMTLRAQAFSANEFGPLRVK